jgi:hypothetical protein
VNGDKAHPAGTHLDSADIGEQSGWECFWGSFFNLLILCVIIFGDCSQAMQAVSISVQTAHGLVARRRIFQECASLR